MCLSRGRIGREVQPPESQVQRHENTRVHLLISPKILKRAHQEFMTLSMTPPLAEVGGDLHRPMRSDVAPQFFCGNSQPLREVVDCFFRRSSRA